MIFAALSMQGCREKHSPFQKDQPDWMAFHSQDYGYSRMSVHNHTHITVEQVSADQVRGTGHIVKLLYIRLMYSCTL